VTDSDSSHPRILPTSEALKGLVDRARAFGQEPVRLRRGEKILSEGETNSSLYILLEGEVELSKREEDGTPRVLDVLGPGSLIGILSFWTGKPSFSDSTAASGIECLRIDLDRFERAVAEDSEFARLTLQLLVANLSDRYRRLAGLNLKVAGLTRELESERNALRKAVTDLQRTRNQLVHKEKLATMGELLAGIAHEINNPSSSLMKSVEQLGRDLPAALGADPEKLRMFEAGRTAPFVSTTESRERMAELQSRYEFLSRGQCRRLARMSPEAFESVETDLRARNAERVEERIRLFEIGSALHSIRVADERITRLVKGLKSYSRQDGGGESDVRVDECIRDTLMVLNHRLKHYNVSVEVPELPTVPGRAGEINQILTNLLANACEATPKGKTIWLRAGVEEGRVWLEVSDEGHGVPEELIERIFEPNVTTKSGGGQYGLGLGLAISRDLALQHQGALRVENRSEGGATFRLELPVR